MVLGQFVGAVLEPRIVLIEIVPGFTLSKSRFEKRSNSDQ